MAGMPTQIKEQMAKIAYNAMEHAKRRVVVLWLTPCDLTTKLIQALKDADPEFVIPEPPEGGRVLGSLPVPVVAVLFEPFLSEYQLSRLKGPIPELRSGLGWSSTTRSFCPCTS